VTSGGGVIVVGEERVKVLAGDTVRVPPKTDHWMEPDGHMDVLLVYLKEW
jgi:mannose-6-phosphate isomerase-like protein (cupin superfamily)